MPQSEPLPRARRREGVRAGSWRHRSRATVGRAATIAFWDVKPFTSASGIVRLDLDGLWERITPMPNSSPTPQEPTLRQILAACGIASSSVEAKWHRFARLGQRAEARAFLTGLEIRELDVEVIELGAGASAGSE